MNKIYKICFLNIIFPLYYRMQTIRKIDTDSVLFIEVRLRKLSNNFSLLEEWFQREKNTSISYVFLEINTVSKREYIRNCFAMLKKLARSQYAFLNEGSNVVSCITLRKETKLVQTWHGCGAFKKFGYCAPDQPQEAYYRNYNLVTVSSPEVVWAYEESMKISVNVIKPLGVSRTDVFFDKERMKGYQGNANRVVGSEKKKKILFAPTFRENAGNAKAPVVMDLELMNHSLGEEYVLMIKYHPVIDKKLEIPIDCKEFVIDVTQQLTIEEAMCLSDICITDYSSLIFEYSLLDKPMLFLAHDLEEYLDNRGFYYDYKDMVPGPICKTTKEIISHIEEIDKYDMHKVRNFRDKFMSECDGNATQRIVNYIKSERC